MHTHTHTSPTPARIHRINVSLKNILPIKGTISPLTSILQPDHFVGPHHIPVSVPSALLEKVMAPLTEAIQSSRRHQRGPANRRTPVALLLLVLLLSAVAAVEEARLVAVDMGAEWIKAATFDIGTTPDQPPTASVDIVLNDQANRKSPPCVSFRCSPVRPQQQGTSSSNANSTDDSGVTTTTKALVCERSFAEEALLLAPRFPTQVVCGPAGLLGFTSKEAVDAAAAAKGGGGALSRLASDNHQHNMASFSAASAAERFLYRVSPDTGREAYGVWIPGKSTSTSTSIAGSNSSSDDEGLAFTPEEFTGMLLGHITESVRKMDAERNALPSGRGAAGAQGPRVRHAAVTVPSFSSVAERQAVVDAGEVSGLRVVRLVHSVTAAATALAYYREEQLFTAAGGGGGGGVSPSLPPLNSSGASSSSAPEPPVHVMIYDMGSRQTEAAIFAVTAPGGGATQGTSPRRGGGGRGRIELLAMATNRTLGGASFDRCIADHWDGTFLAGSVFAPLPAEATAAERQEAGKRRTTLLRAASKARERLSANREAPVTVDGVAGGFNGKDLNIRAGEPFSTVLSRGSFEHICAPLFAAAVQVRDAALATAASTGTGTGTASVPSLTSLSRFEVVGGATRMPRLLQLVSAGYRGGVVDRTLNGDEAVAVGSAYLGAAAAGMLLPKYSVREALTNDIGGFLIVSHDTGGKKEKSAGGGFSVLPTLDDNSSSTVSSSSPLTGAQPSLLLFPAHSTSLPATKSITLSGLDRDGAVFALAAPPQLAGAVLNQAAATASGEAAVASPSVCPGCFLQYNTIEGVADAAVLATGLADLLTRKDGSAVVSLDGTDVVLEAAVSESGVPYLRKAYLRAAYTKVVTAAVETGAWAGDDQIADKNGGNSSSGGVAANGTAAADGNATVDGEGREAHSTAAFGNANNDDEGTEDGEVEEVEGDKATATAAATTTTTTTTTTHFHRTFPLRSHVVYPQSAPVASVQPQHGTARPFLPWLPRSINLSPAEIAASRDRLRHLQAVDDYRYACSDLRNSLEGHLISLRLTDQYSGEIDITLDMIAAAAAASRNRNTNSTAAAAEAVPAPSEEAVATADDLLRWRAVVSEMSDWLDDSGESAGRAELAAATARVERLCEGVARILMAA